MTDDDRTRITFDPRPGVSFAQYRIVDRIGSGGMGEVVLAEDTSLQRMVALKFLPAHAAADADLKDRFLREARAAAALNHPNIIHVYEVGEHEGRPFIAMEHVDGATLRDRMADGPFPLEEALAHGLHLAEALAEAHRMGVVHRDIKPGNIVFDRSGRPKLLDFGLAAMSGAEPITRDGSTLGTVGYMAPETIRGQAADRRSDVFSLGVVLYEMLTGKSPFRQQTEASTLDAVLHREPEPLSRSRAGMPPTLQAVLDKALQKDPQLRHQTADDLAADLRRERRDSDISSASRSRVVPAPEPAKRRLGPLVGVGIAAVLLVGMFWLRPWAGNGDGPAGVPAAEAAERRLLVLPFENLASTDDDDRLGEILSSLLIADLSQSAGLSVVSSQHLHRAIEQAGGDAGAVDEVARRTRADRALTGRVLRADPLVITTELVEVSSGTVLGSHRVQGSAGEDVFALVDRLAPEVRRDLSLQVPTDEGSVSDFTTDDPKAYQDFVLGTEASEKFYFEEGERYLRSAVQRDPEFAAAWAELAVLLMRQGRPQEAREASDRAMTLIDRAGWKDRLVILSVDASMRNEHREAASYIQQIVDRDPLDVDALFWLASLQRHALNDIDLSVPTYQRVVELDPGYAAAWNQLAYCHIFRDRTDQAFAALERYAALLPNDANPLDSRGDLLAYTGRPEEAKALYEEAIRLRPDFGINTRIKIALMDAYLDRPGWEETFREVIAEIEPVSPSQAAWARMVRAGLDAYRGRLNESLAHMEDLRDWIAVQTEELPDYALIDALLNENMILRFQGRFAEAHARVDLALPLAQASEDYSAWWVRHEHLVTYLAEGRMADAKAELARMEALPPEIDFGYQRDWSRGVMAEAEGDAERALRLYEAGKTRDTYPQNRIDLGAAHLRLGDPEGAVRLLEAVAIQCSEGLAAAHYYGAWVHYLLGQAYEEVGRPADAVAQYRIFLDLWQDGDPGLPGVDDAAARLKRLEANL